MIRLRIGGSFNNAEVVFSGGKVRPGRKAWRGAREFIQEEINLRLKYGTQRPYEPDRDHQIARSLQDELPYPVDILEHTPPNLDLTTLQ